MVVVVVVVAEAGCEYFGSVAGCALFIYPWYCFHLPEYTSN